MPDSPGKQKAFPDKHGGDSQKPAKPKASVRVERLRQREFASAGREQNCACTKFCFKLEEDRANARQSGKAESFPGRARRIEPTPSKVGGERPSRAAASARIRECG